MSAAVRSRWRRAAHGARVGVALGATAVAVLSTTILSSGTAPARATDVAASSVRMTVVSVTPSTPAITTANRPLTITVSLENVTDTALQDVTLTAERGDPIGTQAALTASLKDTRARTGGRSITPVHRPSVALTPHVPVTATFRTTTSLVNSDHHLCLCATASVYPIDLTAEATIDGVADAVGGTRTYLPAFDVAPAAKLGVTWIWPLIDRPHRTADGAVFTDDDLSTSVDGGRLDRALQVVEQVATTVPMTLVVDPDLLDELEVMALGRYTVRSANGTLVAGTGQQAAVAWLSRLRTVLGEQKVDIEFTPLADPDITGLTQRDRPWSLDLNTQVNLRVTAALGGIAPTHTLAWPPTNTATTRTLDRLVAGGVNTVVLDGSRVRPSSAAGIPSSLARLRAGHGTVNALLTAPELQRLAAAALTGSTTVLPQLSAELAVRVAQRPTAAQNVVLSAPRYVDPSPLAAAAVIRATSSSVYSSPINADSALEGAGMPRTTSTLRQTGTSSSGLTDQQLDDLGALGQDIPAVGSLIGGSAAGRRVLNTLPDIVQRAESAAWSKAGAIDTVGGGPTAGAARVKALSRELAGYLGSVSILPVSSGNYTLSSSRSPLPISLRNSSTLTVRIRLTVRTVGGLPGFFARDIRTTIPPDSKVTLKVPTHIQRSGRIPVQAELYTPSNHPLGESVQLSVHSTVLGTIGVVITVVAGVVLALALLVRYVRRVLRIRRKRAVHP